MIGISLQHWSAASLRRFHFWWHLERYYWKGYKWTPFVSIHKLDKPCECCCNGG